MKTVHFRWSASEILCVTFVRWQAKLHPKSWEGKREKGWWGVGAVVRSSWAWNYPDGWKASRRHRLPRQHMWLAPHTELFLTRDDCINHTSAQLKRPTLKACKALYKRRLADHRRRSKAQPK